jgi:hypothetical protein
MASRDGVGMKHVWRVQGTYFEWEMTVKVRPAEGAPVPVTEDDQGSAIARMKRVVDHFREAVDLHEYGLQCELVRR